MAIDREVFIGDTGFESSGGSPLESVETLYFRDITNFPRLTAEDEIELAQKRDIGNEARKALSSTFDPQMRAELEGHIAAGEAAKNTLISSNFLLVASVARKYIGKGLPYADLIQAGNIGLQTAAERYDWEKGFRFTTYAHWWIFQGVTRALSDESRTIRLPVHVIEDLGRINRTRDELLYELSREPIYTEIAERLGENPETVLQKIELSRRRLYLLIYKLGRKMKEF